MRKAQRCWRLFGGCCEGGLQTQPLQSLCDNFKQDIVDGPFGSELQRKDYVSEGIPVLKIQNIKPFAIELTRIMRRFDRYAVNTTSGAEHDVSHSEHC